ncbi:MAG TPA: hypothetical protein VFQ33_10970 [Xanthobacteraceae bacterium]|nr:hypothetical protein [Xanthobacteraceae bacterium]
MATQSMLTYRIGVLRLAVTGAITASVVFVLCWLGTFIPFSSPTHAYIALFTPAEMNSIGALVQGTCWSFLFGGLAGAVLAWVYNLLDGLDRR